MAIEAVPSLRAPIQSSRCRAETNLQHLCRRLRTIRTRSRPSFESSRSDDRPPFNADTRQGPSWHLEVSTKLSELRARLL